VGRLVRVRKICVGGGNFVHIRRQCGAKMKQGKVQEGNSMTSRKKRGGKANWGGRDRPEPRNRGGNAG